MLDLRGIRAPDFLAALLDLLPVGWAWTREADGVQARTLAAPADGLARHHERTADLLERESLPPASLELLPDWERVLGLPDQCLPAGPTLVERREAVEQRLAAIGGQTPAYFLAVAAALGYPGLAIEEFRPFVAGGSVCGEPLAGDHDIRFVWRIVVPDVRVVEFRAGAGACGDRLGEIRRAEVLECVLQRARPAHTRLVFEYQGA